MQKRVIALGFFDGVHLGHGALLRRTRELAQRYGAVAAALTFDTHPDGLVRGESVPLLNTVQDRARLMERLYGIGEILPLHFDRQRMNQPWQAFVDETLIGEYGAVHVVCGYDFRFGAFGKGTAEGLRQYCTQRNIGCDCIDEIRIDGKTVSSTWIRELLSEGKTEEACRLLGHGHLLSGTVITGRQLGRTIGIPTANLCPQEGILLPKRGVYAAKAYFEDQSRLAVVNIGSRPTVGGTHTTIEPWLLDYSGELYGKELHLELHAFLREEQRFDSMEQLRQAILNNAEQTRQLLAQSEPRQER